MSMRVNENHKENKDNIGNKNLKATSNQKETGNQNENETENREETSKNDVDYDEQFDMVPVRDAMKLHFRAFRLLYQQCPQAIVSRFCQEAWNHLTPYIIVWMTALLLNEMAGARDTERITRLVVTLLVTSAVIALGKALIGAWQKSVSSMNYYNTMNIYTDKLLSMDYVRLDDPKTHELHSQIMQNINWNGWGLMQGEEVIFELLGNCFGLCGGIALTVSLFTSLVPADAGIYTVLNNPIFLLLLVGIMLAITYCAPRIATKADHVLMEQTANLTFINRFFSFYGTLGVENTENDPDIRIYRADRIADRYIRDKDQMMFCSAGQMAREIRRRSAPLKAASSALSVVFTGIAYLFVCLKALAGAFGIGSVTQYVAAISTVSGNVSGIVKSFGDMQINAAYLQMTFEFLDLPNEMYQGSLTVEKRNDRNYEIEFKDVSFRYPGSEEYSLSHVNMKFRIGERLAVVGPNGSGKTTFIKLLCRLYDPTEGEILLNGINIRKYNYLEYINIFSVVFQDFALFAYGLGQNVAAGAAYDEERVKKCLVDAGFGGRLEQLPHGLDTYLYKNVDTEGVDISGGEAQKIALARTMYKDASFLILDEPTSALDPIAEADVYENFNKIVGDRTAIYISHRLSSCRFCDEIAVFSEGQVVQMGSHDALVKQDGLYARLWSAQAQYYCERK